MPVDVKFCGLTRDGDTDVAASLGAAFVGVIFAASPRRIKPTAAASVLAPARGRARTVGVFGQTTIESLAVIATEVPLDVVQLHGDPSPEIVERIRPFFGGEVWAVVRVDGSELPSRSAALLTVADAVVLDTKVAGQLGGSGKTFDWGAVARALDGRRVRARIVLAGGLTPENVAKAVRTIAPDVVDVSSGVETAPGIKDHARMRAFRDAAQRPGESSE